MSKNGKSTATNETFPYDQFPYKLIHVEGKDKKTCYFQCQNHLDKYLARCKFNSKDYEIFVKPGTSVETVGKVTRRKSAPKKGTSRSSSSN